MSWIHRMFHQCEECLECKSCQTLQIQLEISNQEKAKLLDTIVRLTEPPVTQAFPKSDVEIKPIMPHHVPWQMKRQMMEADDRRKASILKNRENEIITNKATIEDLERELGIDEAANE